MVITLLRKPFVIGYNIITMVFYFFSNDSARSINVLEKIINSLQSRGGGRFTVSVLKKPFGFHLNIYEYTLYVIRV